MFVAPTLSITTAADVFSFRLIDIIMEEPMEVDEAPTEQEETVEPMDDDTNDMAFEISPEPASDDATMDEAPSTTQDDADGDELSSEDVEMANNDEEEIDSLATLLTQLELNVDVTMTDVTRTLQDLHLNENDVTKEITGMMAGMELNGKRKTSIGEEEQDDGELPTRASKRGGFWCGPPRFNIGMAPPKELRCSRRRSRRNRR